MKNIIQISILLIINYSYGQTNSLFARWNDRTHQLLKDQTFSHESIKSDSIKVLFNTLIENRDSAIIHRIDTNQVDVIIIKEIIDYSTHKIIRQEQYIDWAHSDSTFRFDSSGCKLLYSGYGNLNPEWEYPKVMNELPPRCYSFWTGSCIGGLKADYRIAKKFEIKVNENTTFIENYLKIETYINFRTRKTKIAFFVPVRGKRCVNPVAGMWGPGAEGELVLDGYFKN